MADSLFVPPSVNRRFRRNPNQSHNIHLRSGELSSFICKTRCKTLTLLLGTDDDSEDMFLLDDTSISIDLESVEASVATNAIATNKDAVRSSAQTTTSKTKWKADNFERDYQLLQTALSRDNSISNLQQLRRKYTLDHGFTRRPLFKDALNGILNVSAWAALLISCSRAGMIGWAAWSVSTSRWRKFCVLFTESVMAVTNLHYWVVVMSLPLLLLTWAKSDNGYVGTKEVQTYKRRRLMRRLFGDFGPTAL
eukprot:scaffold169773_cov23-Cyclotella_meneghiniana.AAC.1